MNIPKYFRWSFLINFSGTSSQIEDVTGGGKLNSKENESFDIKTKTCIKFTCPINFEPVGLKCIEIANEVKKTFDLPVLTPDFKINLTTKMNQSSGLSVMDVRDHYLLIENIFITNIDYRVYTTEPLSIISSPMTSTTTAFNNFTFLKTSNMTIYKNNQRPVSYTHLTLPTILLV